MAKKQEGDNIDLLQGTLDMLILRTLIFGPFHGHDIARSIQQTSGDVLRIDHGSLYPALQRLERRGWVTAEWGVSKNNRRARYYSLTKSGRKQLNEETGRWERLQAAISRVLSPGSQEG